MFGAGELPVYPTQRVARPSSEMGRLAALLLFVIGLAAAIGVVVALTSGMTNVALIICLFTGAFFARADCLKR